MQSTGTQRRRTKPSPSLLLPVLLSLLIARDAPARARVEARLGTEAILDAQIREGRIASWAAALEPIDVTDASAGTSMRISLYDRVGDIDDEARAAFERVISRDPEPHQLATRVEQLVFKAAYHFGAKGVSVVSGWREHAGKHATGEAIDFRLRGVTAAAIAAYLRGLARLGVGIYTHPGTQFVHVDVRDASYYWIDGSPPGVHWRELKIGDRGIANRDASYASQMDLP